MLLYPRPVTTQAVLHSHDPRDVNAPVDGVDAVVAIDALLRWARASGRGFDAMLPLVTSRFAPADIVAYMDRTRPGAASLREVFEAL